MVASNLASETVFAHKTMNIKLVTFYNDTIFSSGIYYMDVESDLFSIFE